MEGVRQPGDRRADDSALALGAHIATTIDELMTRRPRLEFAVETDAGSHRRILETRIHIDPTKRARAPGILQRVANRAGQARESRGAAMV